jgi:hypothetical protein
MTKEEIEKLVEEAGNEARGSKKKTHHHPSHRMERTRTILNTTFLILAAIGVVVYYANPNNHTLRIVGLCIVGVGMLLKIVEFILRHFF